MIRKPEDLTDKQPDPPREFGSQLTTTLQKRMKPADRITVCGLLYFLEKLMPHTLLYRVLPALFIVLITCGGSIAMTKTKTAKTAIVVASFGTSYPAAVNSLLAIVREIETAYPQTPVQMAFTSNIIRRKWHGREEDAAYRRAHPEVPDYFYRIKNVLGTLADFQDQGYRAIIVQPTLLTPGEEYADVQAYISGLLSIHTVREHWRPFEKIALGRPLMGLSEAEPGNLNDLGPLAEALAEDVKLAEQQQATLVYMGHGNENLANSIYVDFERLMNQRYPQVKTLIGLVEGQPAFAQVLERLSASGSRKVLLKPLMVVAGDHASNDMAGAEPMSWKSQLDAAGYTVQPIMQGLGDNAGVRRLFVNHLCDAAKEAGIELR